ncbi:lipoprotein [Agarivorans sp. OAG1]|uniref:Lipoprotein n=1 Tax=Agarivorans albus MKT 106 TaxID=1331007 RepID=R9PSN1_AGAAL|nr:GNA1162 family protein [Agarivorans albus]BEU04321.1 lipoprotein [Agarivorans sp. OAG1]GAD01166.1 lipoprotein [Agarivorans albus MKT 106]
MFKRIIPFVILIFVSACQTTPEVTQEFDLGDPSSILILPVVNHSVDVNAPLSVYSSLPVMLAEKGYYIFPINTVKTILEYEGLYEAEEIHQLPSNTIAEMFDADSVLYVTINQWDTTYLLLASTTIVDISYEIRGRQGEVLWQADKHMEYTPQNSSTGNALADLIGAVITASINRAAPDYMPLTRTANYQVFYSDAATYLPSGPYLVDVAK